MADGVLLVPGFFGFDTFGAHRQVPIRYFGRVVAALENERPDLQGRIHGADPPPMGPLAARVDALYATLMDALAQGIGPKRLPVDRLHLIGHSIGGVCARLLTNRHHWMGDVRSGSYRDLMRYIGTVVTVAAPLHGTPLATRLTSDFPLSIPGLSLLSIVAKASETMPPRPITGDLLLAEMLRRPDAPGQATLDLLLGLDPETAGEIARFLDRTVADHAVLRDLAPETMRRVNARLANGDHPDLRHVVTVAPPPPDLHATAGITDELFRLLYATLYQATADPAFEPAAFPLGAWMDGSDRTLAAAGPVVNDGVVPSCSQTLTGTAGAIVEADHLDVVGHYRSRRFRGTTVLRSGAAFDDVDFQQLWSTIGGMLR